MSSDSVHAELADRLRAMLRANSITQVELSQATGFSEKHISQLLAGKAGASTRAWSALLAAAAETSMGDPFNLSSAQRGETAEDIEQTIHALNAMCCGGNEPPPGAKTAREWEAVHDSREPKRMSDRFEWLLCGSCLGLRFGPGHLMRKYVFGVCDD